MGAINAVKLAEGGDYRDEGVACYVYDTPVGGASSALFRLYHPISGDHFYTTSLAERDNAIANLGYTSEGIACYVFDTPVGGATGELFRLYHPISGDHFYTISDVERQSAIDQSGYGYEQVACYVEVTPVAGTTPFYRLGSNSEHFYTTSAGERDAVLHNPALVGLESIWLNLQSNDDMFREEDWFRNLGTNLKSALKRTSSGSQGLSLNPFSPSLLFDFMKAGIQCAQICLELQDLQQKLGQHPPPRALYNLTPISDKLHDSANLDLAKVRQSGITLRLAVVGLESGALRQVTQSGLLLGSYSGEHFYTDSTAERDNATTNLGYTGEGIACYVYDTPVGGAPGELFRLVHPVSGDHFYTASSVERQNAVDTYGYSYEGVACYVDVTPVVGTTPFYRLVSNSEHFYTTSATERDFATANLGYISEGIACYVFDAQAPGTTALYRLVKLA